MRWDWERLFNASLLSGMYAASIIIPRYIDINVCVYVSKCITCSFIIYKALVQYITIQYLQKLCIGYDVYSLVCMPYLHRTLLKQGPYGMRPIVKKIIIITPGSLVKVKND